MKLSTVSLFSLTALANLASSLECPSVGAMCLYQGDIAYVFGNKNLPECWEKNGTSNKCFRKLQDGKCPREGLTTDVSACPGFAPQSVKPECPAVGTMCLYQGDIRFPFGKNTPECWEKNGSSFKCYRKAENANCAREDVTRDVSTCPGYIAKH